MKTIRLTALLLFSPLYFFGQSLTGLWIGSLNNDSTTIRQEQSFEIALTEYKGKVYGYTRSEFIVNDTLYFIVKRVKGTIEGNICEVKDDEIISYNFRGKLEKGVKVVHTFRLNKQDSSWHLDGKWKTNATKKYYALTGKAALNEEKDLGNSKIFPHLEELNLGDDIAFYKEQKQKQENFHRVVTIKKEEPVFYEREITNQPISQPGISSTIQEKDLTWFNKEKEEIIIDKTNTTTEPTITNDKKQEDAIVKTVPVKDQISTVAINKQPEKNNNNLNNTVGKITSEKTTKIEQKPLTNVSSSEIKKLPEKKEEPAFTKAPVVETKEPVINKLNVSDEVNKQSIASINTDIQKTNNSVMVTTAPVKQPVLNTEGAATEVNVRKSEFSQSVIFKSDSLQLALYDNGEIDGDTVSVLLNGEIILPKQGLKASAIRKTIYITPEMGDSLVLVLYAENLGKYPPNTGLLVVRDGDDIYNVRFSADLQRNAAIVFRRKPR